VAAYRLMGWSTLSLVLSGILVLFFIINPFS
jgi:hypothetical protein